MSRRPSKIKMWKESTLNALPLSYDWWATIIVDRTVNLNTFVEPLIFILKATALWFLFRIFDLVYSYPIDWVKLWIKNNF